MKELLLTPKGKLRSHQKHKEIATFIAIFKCDKDGRVVVHNENGTVDYVLDWDDVLKLRGEAKRLAHTN